MTRKCENCKYCACFVGKVNGITIRITECSFGHSDGYAPVCPSYREVPKKEDKEEVA